MSEKAFKYSTKNGESPFEVWLRAQSASYQNRRQKNMKRNLKLIDSIISTIAESDKDIFWCQ